MSNYQKHFLITIALVIAAVAIFFSKDLPFRKGLDIDGGMRVVFQADPTDRAAWGKFTSDEKKKKMESVRNIIEKRVGGFSGVSEPIVYIQNFDRLVVEMPGVKDPEKALKEISSTAALEFYYLRNIRNANNPMGQWQMSSEGGENRSYMFIGPNNERIDSIKNAPEVLSKVVDTKANKPELTGKDILPNAKAGINGRQQINISIEFNREGAITFGDFTRKHVNDALAIFFNGELLTAPNINEPIMDGNAEITGFRSLPEARQIAGLLNAGALPIPLKILAKDVVEPTLGKETISKVVVAGIMGLALVIAFMFAYYKLPGAISVVALILYTLFTCAVFKLFKVTMSLAGVSALIISIGMAVDANILIFERLKEELRSGKTLRAAIDAGFGRAFTAIFDSNMCTAITCAILMSFGSPSVKSFAMTLIIGVAISMFTAITVTRTILHLLVTWEWAQKPSLYGLNTGWLHNMSWNVVGKRNWFFAFSALLIVPGVIFLFVNHAKYDEYLKRGIEFQSGTSIQATFEKPVVHAALKAAVESISKPAEVQLSKVDGMEKRAFIKTLPLGQGKEIQLRTLLNDQFGLLKSAGHPVFDSVSSVDPTVSRELTSKAFLSVLIASLLIILYLTGRFAIGGLAEGFKYGVCAVIALIHDALFILGLFAILGYFLNWEIDSLFVTAVLTIIGFSVHDTIVVFDRIRENLRHRERGESFEALANKSIMQTLTRSINTTLTVVLTLSMLIAFGGPLLRHFYITMLVGIIIGTYSSIFNATPLVIVWDKLASKTVAEPKKKVFEDKALVEKPKAASKAAVDSIETDESTAAKSDRIKRKTTKKRRF
ncbi:MAG: protein translocase subunit SecD [Armatimonadetes bacterium]|nr:protein translocase subunit SecD [Armatimonadota bacterium]